MLEKFVDRLCKLLEVKSIITILLMSVAAYGFVNKMISTELFAAWVSAVITYFFAKKDTSKV